MLPFGARSPLSAEDEEWQLETWRWMPEELGSHRGVHLLPLVTPTKEFFPPTDTQGHARAEHVFATVKHIMGLGDWPCRLIAQPDSPDAKVSDFAYLKFDNKKWNPGGTFSIDGNEVVVTYSPELVSDPIGLVKTLAHELSHYVLSAKGEPPGGWDNHEFCTDLAVAYFGFGIFGASSAFRYYSTNQGWGYSRSGYLTQTEWTFALAVFLALRGQAIESAKPWLAPHLMAGVARAAKYLARHETRLPPLKAASTGM